MADGPQGITIIGQMAGLKSLAMGGWRLTIDVYKVPPEMAQLIDERANITAVVFRSEDVKTGGEEKAEAAPEKQRRRAGQPIDSK